MKLGEFFIEVGIKSNVKELQKTERELKKAEKQSARLIKYRRDLAKATSEEEKALIKKNFAQKVELDKTKEQISVNNQQKTSLMGVVRGFTAFVGGVSVVIGALDRMINATARANQQMITLSRTSGISLGSFSKYASASASVNYNSSPEQVAQSMSRVANNLWDIRMGRGDISPYQELSFVGGKAFSPVGMSVEQVIEQVRESIKGVNDLQATNIITRMGFSPEDLLMLRMSRKEFEEIQNLFLSPKEQKAMNKYSLQLGIIHKQFSLINQQVVLKLFPYFNKIMESCLRWEKTLIGIVENITKAVQFVGNLETGFGKIKDVLQFIIDLIWLPIEDVLSWLAGKDSLTGRMFENIGKAFEDLFKNFKLPKIEIPKIEIPKVNDIVPFGVNKEINNNSSNNFNQNNNVTIHTTQPADEKTVGYINEQTALIANNTLYSFG